MCYVLYKCWPPVSHVHNTHAKQMCEVKRVPDVDALGLFGDTTRFLALELPLSLVRALRGPCDNNSEWLVISKVYVNV